MDNKTIKSSDAFNNKKPIGQFLSCEREKRGISQKEMSARTKIHLTNLKRIENNDFLNLPRKTYLIGYIKAYCKILGLSLDNTVLILEDNYREFLSNNANTNTVDKEEKVTFTTDVLNKKIIVLSDTILSKVKQVNNNLFILAVASFVLILFFIFLLQSTGNHSQNIKSSAHAKRIKVSGNRFAKDKLVSVKQEIIKEKVLKKKVLNKKEKINQINTKKQPITENKNDTTKILETKYYSLAMPLYIIDTSKTKEEIKKMIPNNMYSVAVKGESHLLINAYNGDSWLTYKKDADKIKKFILKKGRSILIRGNKILLFLGNVANTRVFLNNNLILLPTKTNVKSLVFPISLASRLKTPLFSFKNGSVSLSDYNKDKFNN